MIDPLPFHPPPLLAILTEKISSYTSLHTLPFHIHELIGAFLFYHLTCLYISPFLSTRLCPRTYPQLPWKTKLNWDVHVVSFVQSVLINVLALWTIYHDEERKGMNYKERIWGYTGAGGLVQAMAGGYFVWDLWVSAVHVDVFGYGLLAHAVSALSVYMLGYRPFVHYYGPIFILYELSSPFLNIHWFLDKLHLTGSNFQLVNGIILMSTFFGCRLVWGPYQSYHVFKDIFAAMQYQSTVEGMAWLKAPIAPSTSLSMGEKGRAAREVMKFQPQPVPMWLAVVYLSANLILTGLNVYWFGKMIETIRKRFPPPFGTRTEEDVKKDKPDEKLVVMGRGVDDSGSKSVDVEQKELRHRGVKSKISAGVSEQAPPQ